MNYVVTIQKYVDHSLNIQDVMKHLGCSERTVYRYAARYKKQGPPGLLHGLRGKSSNNRNRKWEELQKYAKQERFSGFGPTLLSEKLEDLLGYHIPIESLRRRMTERGVWMPRKPYKIKRTPRKRKDGYGMMIQFDGSYHDRLENGEERCLLLGVDDATGKVMPPERGCMGSLHRMNVLKTLLATEKNISLSMENHELSIWTGMPPIK